MNPAFQNYGDGLIIATGPSECPKCGAEIPAPKIHKTGYEIPKEAYPFDYLGQITGDCSKIWRGHSIDVLETLVQAIDAKWTDRKSQPPKELVGPLERAKELLNL